jgi:5-methylthioadenosine/S-adenosylhomocysteine deaminase
MAPGSWEWSSKSAASRWKKADICILDMNKPHLTPMYSAYSHLAYAVTGSDVETVLINGRVVMRNRRLMTINEQEVMDRVRTIATSVERSLRRSLP